MQESKNLLFFIWFICLLHCIFSTLVSASWFEVGSSNAMEGTNQYDQVGISLGINSGGNILAIGENGWNNFNGRVRVYQLFNGIWSTIGDLSSMIGEDFFDSFGISVAINSYGTIVVVGEPGWSGDLGRVRTYQLSNGIWTEFGGATAMTGQNIGDGAGYTVAINSDGIVVVLGEPGWDNRGRVRTYSLSGDFWTEFGGETAITGQSTGDNAGEAIAISSDGTVLVVGENGWSSGSGRVRTYQLSNGMWMEFGGAIAMTGQSTGDNAGKSVAISSDGTVVAVGENGWNSGSGRVRTYSLSGGNWAEFGGATTMTGQNQDDNAGCSIALSSNGTVIAVGENGWSGGSGRVRTYRLSNGMWKELGVSTMMVGENLGDQAGYSVAINSGGTRVAIGELGWFSGSYNGRVRVYVLSNKFNPNRLLSKILYSDVSSPTTPGARSNVSPGQGAPFSDSLTGYIITKGR